ncbi:TPA: hypothetical protein MM073_001847 [Klebsiella pneumoniae]|uniref:hypothetical protein n=1 Tax=Klebsiella pneumoniae TaxID=573 RepID=UPI000E2B6D75|nr:hypothetical protein [Klebsiella pneumoniae]DAI64825.1 MAG TPA: hypothetical protein [Caudoviricetes sp.]HDS3201978.1 hypothetical protein [Klebsiella pneumoniae subsp. pneumoniae]EKZ9735702.1 hypothetical protein [Klebsiella pneumoniae]MBD7742743.1 hypothetical protein [Klebsiella pneumoniae]WJT90645.1 hypothetical protein QU740_19135 [Klebsiella pneumoniae]
MTKSTITRERLAKIKSWRETYGAGSNVMLPAEEAEELARIALAAMDSEPVAWTDEEELRDVNVAGIGYLFGIDREANKFADPLRQIMLYRHAQPAPAFPDFDNVLESLDYEVRCNAWESEHVLKACQATYDACRAAMLQPGNSPVIGIDPASGPDYSVEVRYVAPPGYVMVPKDLLSELRDWAHPEIEKYCEMWEGRRDSEFPALRKVIADADALLAAAPQEVKGE